jgi:hypothetical protein
MIEIKFSGDPATVLQEASMFVAQLGTGHKMLSLAAQQRHEEAEQPAAAVPEQPAPTTEPPKPKAGRPKAADKKTEPPAPTVEKVEQTVEDVFDDGPAPAEENQDEAVAIPSTMEEMKAYFMKAGLSPEDNLAILKKYSDTGKLSGIPQARYKDVVKAIDTAKAKRK